MINLSSKQGFRSFWNNILPATILLASVASSHADGIYRDGIGAKSMSLGGADVSWADSPLVSLGDNPAGLGFMHGNMVDLGVSSVYPSGHFSNSADPNGYMINNFSTAPEGAISAQLGHLPATAAIGFYPESGLLADWRYTDPAGGTGGMTSYGFGQEKSEIIVLRTALGIGVQLTRQLSIGASVGLVYNQNELVDPYVFQDQAALPKGFKTLLDLQTSGWGADGNFGIQYRPLDNLQFGIAYKTESRIRTNGDATGNAYAQLNNLGLGAAQSVFHYDAEVTNVFPQSISTGVTWKVIPKLSVTGQIDWTDWASFGTLPVTLTNGSNKDVNGVVKSTSLGDSIPLAWKDELSFHVGVEYQINDNFFLRGGYVHENSPVPTSTLTPLTAVIVEDTLAAGIGYQRGPFSIDAAYQYGLPETRNIGVSSLAAGELNNSSVRVTMQSFTITASYKF